MTAPPETVPPRAVAPVASVWCRQVDNEAESPGYTSIPDDFPGYREALESIRIVGNLTINVADTHDYWDPGPSQSLSFYPNLFLYPAAGRRYTCVGRMFLSTEDRPRLGMKTLVFSTAELTQSGEFGRMVLRAHATMDGRGDGRRVAAEPDPAVFQAIGDGFLFAKGSNDPVVVVASEQWEAAAQAVLDIVAGMPAALVALGAFLVFPYFLPAGKVNFAEFAEQLPTALAVMRVARGEAVGERHEKRVKSWEEQSVALRDLTKPTSGKKADALPLVLQYIRDHEEDKGREVVRRVDAVELPRLGKSLADGDHAPGKEVRKEMWRIGAAMETAAILLSKPKGRSVPMTGEAAKRANLYLNADPGAAALPSPTSEVAAGAPAVAAATAATLPAWLRPAPQISTAATDTVGVPVSTSDDPSLRASSEPTSPSSGAAPSARAPAVPVGPAAPTAAAARAAPAAPPALDPATVDARIAAVLKEQQAAWILTVETRLRDSATAQRSALDSFSTELAARVTALEGRPIVDPAVVDAQIAAVLAAHEEAWRTAAEARYREAADSAQKSLETVGARVSAVEGRPTIDPAAVDARIAAALADRQAAWTAAVDQRLAEAAAAEGKALQALGKDLAARLAALEARPVNEPAASATAAASAALDAYRAELQSTVGAQVRTVSDEWATRFRADFTRSLEEFRTRAAKSEEELRTALVAQLEVEVNEAREQGTVLREEIEARARAVVEERVADLDRRHARETHDLEQRLGVLIDGRSKDLESRIATQVAQQKDRLAALADERVGRVEQRIATEREARLSETVEAQTEALAGLQVRMQSYVETTLRENLTKEREQFVGLLARLKAQTDEALAHAVDASRLDGLLRDRFAELIASAEGERAREIATAVAPLEARLRTGQQELSARVKHLEASVPAHADTVQHIERAVRRELDDFDRRLKIVHDHVLPMVRQTWLKVSQQETGGNTRELREALEREIQRVETSLQQQQAELRDQLETAVAQHGRIWLNLIHEISREESAIATARNRARRPHGLVRPVAPPPVASPPTTAAAGEFPPEAGSVRRPRRGSP